MRFKIHLKAAHDKSGLTAYEVWKKTGVVQSTVKKYISDEPVISDYVHVAVVQLADFYGVDWRDKSIVAIVDENTPNKKPTA